MKKQNSARATVGRSLLQVGTLGRKQHDYTLRFPSPEDGSGRVPLVLHVVADGVMGMDREARCTVTVRES